MNFIPILIFLEIFFSALVFLVLAFQTFKTWRTLREELLLHLTIFFLAMVIIIIIFSIYFSPNIFDLSIDVKLGIVIMGILYDLFYLEVSIIYLSIFTNSRTIFESYAPFIIGAATVVNLYSEISASFNNSNQSFTLFLHGIVITIGILLIILGIMHLFKSKKYISESKELDLLNYIIKLGKYLPVLLIMDGIGFIFYEINASSLQNISEVLFLFEYSIIVVVSALAYYVAHSLGSKAKEINITNFLNTIS